MGVKTMNWKTWIAVMAVAASVAACGGGGGGAGTPLYGSSSGTGTTSGGSSGGTVTGTDVVAVPTAISFVSVSPADAPLIIQGATANGRTSTGTLTFKVVDQAGKPVSGETVQFSVIPANAVTLNYTSAKTDATGVAAASVTSKTQPTTIVVQAVVASNTSLKATSDTLSVSGGDPIQAGFQIVAEKYNLDGNFVGDTTKVTAFVRDTFGNPVSDGYAVVFTTDLGAVTGQCATSGNTGQCFVTFTVQSPTLDGAGNSLATVTATGNLNTGSSITDNIKINLAGAGGSGYRLLDATTGNPVSSPLPLTSCKQDVAFLIDDGNGHAPAAGTTVKVLYGSNGATASVKVGSPVADALDAAFSPQLVVMSFDLSNLSSSACGDSTANTTPTAILVNLTSPHGVSTQQSLTLSYPL